MFLNLVCSSSETLSGLLKRLLDCSEPSTSVPLLPLCMAPPMPILNLSSNSLKSICLKIFSSSSSLKMVPRTWKRAEISLVTTTRGNHY